MSYIHHLERSGVTNIEMESLAFAALTHHAGIRAAVICVSLLDRIRGDQASVICYALHIAFYHKHRSRIHLKRYPQRILF